MYGCFTASKKTYVGDHRCDRCRRPTTSSRSRDRSECVVEDGRRACNECNRARTRCTFPNLNNPLRTLCTSESHPAVASSNMKTSDADIDAPHPRIGNLFNRQAREPPVAQQQRIQKLETQVEKLQNTIHSLTDINHTLTNTNQTLTDENIRLHDTVDASRAGSASGGLPPNAFTLQNHDTDEPFFRDYRPPKVVRRFKYEGSVGCEGQEIFKRGAAVAQARTSEHASRSSSVGDIDDEVDELESDEEAGAEAVPTGRQQSEFRAFFTPDPEEKKTYAPQMTLTRRRASHDNGHALLAPQRKKPRKDACYHEFSSSERRYAKVAGWKEQGQAV
ncbi:hypothetical protein HMN09_01255500 [Mycena chlorophos]|uniref:Zn(2)-C6 fungal-type domain-containing protein n=1 Tax=Mycena chlorophos TaxID=658473 RepID=A0A8H6S2S5_MYCCL|nr:hypothetical protein HMN09_01255500 [Mycena chlorophos]